MEQTAIHFIPSILVLSLKTRVSAILLSLDTVDAYEKRGVADSKGPASQFLKNCTDVANIIKLKSKDLEHVLRKAGIEVTLPHVKRLLLSWLDSDLLNIAPEHLVVLIIALLMAKDWLAVYCSDAVLRPKLEKPINELVFALAPHVRTFPVIPSLVLLSSLLPLAMVDQEIEELKQKHEKSDTALLGPPESSSVFNQLLQRVIRPSDSVQSSPVPAAAHAIGNPAAAHAIGDPAPLT